MEGKVSCRRLAGSLERRRFVGASEACLLQAIDRSVSDASFATGLHLEAADLVRTTRASR